MTDEEKAEEIANKKCRKMFCYTLCNVNKNHHCGEWHYNKECALEGIEYGLAEGRKEKFHDLRKNPNDLPKEDGHYWCYVDDGVFHTDYGVIYFENGKWESEKWENKTIILIWCELPKFEG